jgi:hypothetical protein
MVIAALEATRGAGAGRILSVEPFVYLGKISYGTYLWHWPVIVVITSTVDPGTGPTIALTVLIATALASLSFQILEHPIRISKSLDRHRRAVVAIGLATSVIGAVVLIPNITNPSTSSAAAADQTLTTTGFTPVPKGIDWAAVRNDKPSFIHCRDQPVSDCTVVRGSGPHVLLIGDSHAAMLVPAFKDMAVAQNLTLSVDVYAGCPWQRQLYVADGQGCETGKEDLYSRVIPELKPDIIVAVNFGYEDPLRPVQFRGPQGQPLKNGSPEYEAWIKQATDDSVAQLRAGDRHVVLVEPIPYATRAFDPVDCLSQATVVEQCRYTADLEPTPLEKEYRRLDKQDGGLWAIDLDKLVCPFLPICDPIIDHKIVKFDATHLTPQFAESLAPQLAAVFKQNGIL